jgi:glycosyltransferase involved in cell wall biosynthesis
MRIGFDLRPFLRQETGVGVYFRNLLRELAALDRDNEYFLFSSSWKDRFSPAKLPAFAKMRFRDVRLPVRVLNFLWYRLGWPKLDFFFQASLDLTHSPVPLFLPAGGKKVITVCDLFFLEHPELADKEARRTFVRSVGRAVERADAVITISEYSRSVILDRLSADKDKVRAIPLGLDPVFFEEPPAEELAATRRSLDLPERFLLFVGAFEPRKNLTGLVEAMRIIHGRSEKIPLVIAGRRGGDYESVLGGIRRAGLEEKIRAIGYIPDSELRRLYRLAAVFIFPSLAEGFGLPILEAMASGLPVAASRTSAMPEVAGEAAVYFDPSRPEDMAAAVIRLLEDEGLRRKLADQGKARARAFSWTVTARRTLDLYRSLS